MDGSPARFNIESAGLEQKVLEDYWRRSGIFFGNVSLDLTDPVDPALRQKPV